MYVLAEVTRTPLGTDSIIFPSPRYIATWPFFTSRSPGRSWSLGTFIARLLP